MTILLTSIATLALVTVSGAKESSFEIILAAQILKLNEAAKVPVASDTLVADEERFETRVIVLDHPTLGPTRLKMRAPKEEGQWPLLFMATGLLTGMDALDLVKTDLPIVTVAFDYPIDKEAKGLESVAKAGQTGLKLQGQISFALSWLKSHPRVRRDRISLLNVSFGTFAVPAAQRVAQAAGFEAYATIFAFGGAELGHFVGPNVESQIPLAERDAILAGLRKIADVLDPRHHLPHLKGRFLVIQAAQDEVIPKASGDAVFQLLPEPKRLDVFQTPHINTDRPEIIEATVKRVVTWLNEVGALD